MKKFLVFLFALVVFVCITGTASAAVLEINGGTETLGGNLSYDSVTITNGGTLYVSGWLNLVVTDSLYVDSTSFIDGTARSYNTGGLGGAGGAGAIYEDFASPGQNGYFGSLGSGQPGGGGAAATGWGGSVGGGGTGGTASAQSGTIVGDETARDDYTLSGYGGGGGGGGAGGAGYESGEGGSVGNPGQAGGASVRLAAPLIEIYGDILVNGGAGGSGGDGGIGDGGIFGIYNQGGGGGGGAGGSAGMIFLDGNDIDISGATLSAIGGDGGLGGNPNGEDGDGLGGADGRIKIFYVDTFLDTGTNYHYGTLHTEVVPIPSALWLLGSGLIGIVGIRRKFKG